MSTFSTVSELEPYKEICHIILLWENFNAADRYTIELVLCDSFGDKIHASISSALVAPYEPRLKEGYWKNFENFSVVQSGAHSWMEQLSERGEGQYDQDGVGYEGLESGGCSFSTESKLSMGQLEESIDNDCRSSFSSFLPADNNNIPPASGFGG
ncbi:hypothetical protein F2Q69_00054624 [Brassica cretica]|uniref:Replication protein A 70 kDa DNA-binding subunit B/D first OB fold domain-containing protein n=1 Tax=Brassica cretica TaxID=69181 RepID=A0A8S9N534_BRACR|nr:hypothetical protein F2Q69_00054624 [Brassica cretica]